MKRNTHRSRFLSRGFTLIELLIVMIIIALLSAIVGPKLFRHVGESEQKAAKVQIQQIGTALDLYRLDYGRYPSTEQGLHVLWAKPDDDSEAQKWKGPYLQKPVEKDPWKNPYVYKSPGDHGEYDLSSLGADGKEGGEGDNADINSWE
ncbi:MAG: type II secretion system major pseudopilin GspG [Betaproteobacteria bacterium]|nr:type II secretion system major pseudopilin GspG [Betaproteobacteria bacterium]